MIAVHGESQNGPGASLQAKLAQLKLQPSPDPTKPTWVEVRDDLFVDKPRTTLLLAGRDNLGCNSPRLSSEAPDRIATTRS